MRQITFSSTFGDWQQAARQALQQGWEPGVIAWQEQDAAQPALEMFAESEPASAPAGPRFRVPKAFVPLAERVACHRDPRRWALLYRVLWRLTHGEAHLLEIMVDPDVHALLRMDKAVRRDIHKMRAFVRFRVVPHAGGEWYVAWFEPEHHIVEKNTPFFLGRFAALRWSILTPERCVHWDGAGLSFTVGVAKSAAPTEDGVEALWLTYYANIFNPARVKVSAMESEMPRKYWKNLPEAAVIPGLLQAAPGRVREMIARAQALRTDETEEIPE